MLALAHRLLITKRQFLSLYVHLLLHLSELSLQVPLHLFQILPLSVDLSVLLSANITLLLDLMCFQVILSPAYNERVKIMYRKETAGYQQDLNFLTKTISIYCLQDPV